MAGLISWDIMGCLLLCLSKHDRLSLCSIHNCYTYTSGAYTYMYSIVPAFWAQLFKAHLS